MRFFVAVPFKVYLLYIFIVVMFWASIGAYALAAGVILAFFYFLFTAPMPTILVILALLAIKFWQPALIIAAVVLVIFFLSVIFSPKKKEEPSLEITMNVDEQPSASDTGAASSQVTNK